ncbi:binding-protein-dependent transport systems inner membrane component [Xylanimonas cellulosilytica DSM 15894]|uniref:Binding-protein-dependent transport systems inner membrane component n=1 Tax=Xylanimonas cellulosilytica (strain DSM 15894 / JCM 12276 / CECT 5975 / KCTC 9989 / LMG 20990 / NBRC 107835 / XIL07) TaxID=446471 RepID=D1BXX9_XYLCX|nr:carbohydrate ABC transporter permease [Xylanimonas cellulosilytica]ACZ31770.1 binding-protein-dependent transport systems inner membrane component [Xylanimonas cellulosilytica DSM 15894]
MATTTLERTGDIEIRHKRVWSWSQPWVYLVALVAVAVAVGPVIWIVLGGARTNPQLLTDPAGLPDPWNWSNYAGILWGQFASRFWGQLMTSTIIAFGTTAAVVVLGTSVAYAIARFPMRGTGVLFSLFAAGLMFPATIGILPTWIILGELGLIGQPLGVIIPQVAFALPVTVVILTPFVKAIPKELEEAASIDGAGRTRFFFRILLPLARPGMVTVGVLAFVGSWNAYMLPLFVLGVGGAGAENHTLPLGVQMFTTQFSASMTSIMAFTTLASIPALIFFLAMQKYIVNGLSGAVKG